ncbi:MAG: nuclear transport factor 2 family protein [Acidobacteriota bacterium]
MSTHEIAAKLVEYCNTGKSIDAINELYADDIVSVESAPMPGLGQEAKGKEAILGKNEWWINAHEVHDLGAKGPYLIQGSDQFGVIFNIDVTNKESGQRYQADEIALYTVADGKIVKEEFFAQPMPPQG